MFGAAAALVAALAAALPRPDGEPTFARDVAPIVYARCTPCHHAGGSAPFALASYRDVQKRAGQIGLVVRSGYMPPWKPEPGYGRFADERRLAPAELERLTRWIEAGAPRGDAAREPAPPPTPDGWQLGAPDLVLELPRPYAVAAEGLDVWRCFALPTGLDRDRYVSAVEIRPSNRRVVHHVILYVDGSGRAAAIGAESDELGLPGMCVDAVDATDQLAGWVPGMTARPLPEGLAMSLPRGAAVVLDTHFQPTGRVEHERTRVGLYFADGPPGRPATLVRLGASSINIPPGRADYRVTDALELPVEVEAIGVAPHAHYVGREVHAWAELPDGGVEPLIRIPDWDFAWQDLYRYAEPVALPAGTRVRVEFVYDNSRANRRNPHAPPRRVIGGPRSVDEMGGLWLQVVVAGEDELARLRAASRAHDAALVAEGGRTGVWWRYMVDRFDADGDGSLDAGEERAAGAFVDGLEDRPDELLAAFDADRDGALSDAERTEARRLVALWRGE